MKNYFMLSVLYLSIFSNAQISGNANYENNSYKAKETRIPLTTTNSSDEMTITIKGIYNTKATSLVAVFSILQAGKTAEEANTLMDERLNKVNSDIKSVSSEIQTVTDMISFVPMYSYDVEKKLFNPKTYNEKPIGFELRKNLIVKFKDGRDLDKILSVCARQEIYDLAKVDYIISDFDKIREELQTKAIEKYKQMIANYSTVMNIDFSKKEKTINEGYNVLYPMENYIKYQAFSQANTNFDNRSVINDVRKNTSQYYDGSLIKSHTFIVNPDIIEPCVQVFYEMDIKIKLKDESSSKNSNYYIITANGDIKPLNL